MFLPDAVAEHRPVAAAPLVSIIIDNYNHARFVERSIQSALAQAYANVEVLVVDDASTDGSPEVIARYADRALVILLTVNCGQAAAFNAGFRSSRGDIVMFLDADDWLYPDAVARVVAGWQPGQSKTHFRLDLVDRDGARVDTHPAPEVRLGSGDVRPQLYRTGRYETVVTTGNAFARAALEPNMPIPETAFRIAADGYLATVVPFHGPVVAIEDCLGAYRMHGGNAFAGNSVQESPASLAARLRRRLEHDVRKDEVLRVKAAAAGVRIDGEPYQRDGAHLELRLASLRLDPAGHPEADDRPLALALRGIAASGGLALPPGRRLLTGAWFLAVGVLPRPLAARLVSWKLSPSSRPAGLDRWLKRVRRALN